MVLECLPKEGGLAGIHELFAPGIYDEAEEGAKKGESEPFGGLPSSFGEAAQKGEDLLRGQGIPSPFTELGGKFCEKVFVIPDCVFFSSSSCGSL